MTTDTVEEQLRKAQTTVKQQDAVLNTLSFDAAEAWRKGDIDLGTLAELLRASGAEQQTVELRRVERMLGESEAKRKKANELVDDLRERCRAMERCLVDHRTNINICLRENGLDPET